MVKAADPDPDDLVENFREAIKAAQEGWNAGDFKVRELLYELLHASEEIDKHMSESEHLPIAWN